MYQARQGKATYAGVEVEANAHLGTLAGIEWGLDAVADATRATIRNVGPAPLIPPVRVLAGLTGKVGAFDGRVEVERSWAQRRNAALELPTPGFTLVNANLDWKPLPDRPELTLSLAANNIFDVEARRATSLLKDYSPIAGRDFRLTAHVEF